MLLVRRVGKRRLEACQLFWTFLHEGETLAEAARRALRTKVGVEGLELVQLCVLDDPGRDDRGRVLSVAHLDVVAWPPGVDRLAGRTRGTRRRGAGVSVRPRLDRGAASVGVPERARSARAAGGPSPCWNCSACMKRCSDAAFPRTRAGAGHSRSSGGTGRTQAGVVGNPARLFERRVPGPRSDRGSRLRRGPGDGRGRLQRTPRRRAVWLTERQEGSDFVQFDWGSSMVNKVVRLMVPLAALVDQDRKGPTATMSRKGSSRSSRSCRAIAGRQLPGGGQLWMKAPTFTSQMPSSLLASRQPPRSDYLASQRVRPTGDPAAAFPAFEELLVVMSFE